MNNQNLVPKKITDKNGKQTTVLVNPDKGKKPASKPAGGTGWATSSPARVSHRNRVESVPAPPASKPSLSGLAALAPTGTMYDEAGYDRDGYDADGYDRNHWNRDGFHRNGYDRQGYDRESGIHLSTGEAWDERGFDRNGYDRDGYDREGFDISGRNRDGSFAPMPIGQEAQEKEFVRRVKENRDLLPADTEVIDDGYGYDITSTWSVDDEGILLTQEYEMRVHPHESETTSLIWRENVPDESHLEKVETEDGEIHYVPGAAFDEWADRAVEGINDGLDDAVRDANRYSRPDIESEEALDRNQLIVLAEEVGFHIYDDENSELMYPHLRDLVRVKAKFSVQHINRDEFIDEMRNQGRYPY